jgi:5-enolpyruvylshikimate-3-phosphate synthase
MITTIVEGFGSEAECKAYREDTLDMLQALGMKLESTKCAEKKGA